MKENLPGNIQPRFTYKGKKIGSYFSVKDKVPTIHETNLVYGYNPSGETGFRQGYIGETNVRYGRRAQEHASWDKASSIYKFGQRKNIQINFEDFQILEKGLPKYKDRKIAEALYIKDFSPELNEQIKSYKLKLFN